ncbi:hypothetical protein MUB24_08690 [Lederbergia sp. NSJ-179]|uniref:hypothetical protein n=1 Tax=Lederbergia sp. NSJ-179 TaxID=2931402 RepID=UPI001FD006D8|nr:hypothetical protein [Lederbergia sp. NSJ-179]MCJ7840977.1 hypothetical protein [Lederbergia sp. NSJ-179]
MNKNPFIAFLLAFFPGGGLMYLGKVLRGLFYMATVIGIPLFSFMIAFATLNDVFTILSLGGVLLYLVNFIDTAVTASKLYQQGNQVSEGTVAEEKPQESERFFTIILSFVPGLGHFQLGLVYRGTTLLVAFFGAAMMIFFVTLMTERSEFLIFLASLPIIWFFGFFDALKQLDKKQKGEELEDKSILEDLENRNTEGKKSKAIATLLAIFPGAGHLYLGLQKRGIQLMAAFLFSIYILDVLRLGIFLFIVPIIWFFSFFDGLQKASRAGEELENEDVPIVSVFVNHQKWVGIGFIVLGIYYIGLNVALPIAEPFIQKWFSIDLYYWVREYVQTALICLLLIGGGIKLLTGKKIKSDQKRGEAK